MRSTTYYRCSLQEANCEPLYSDALKVNALGDIIFDEIIKVTEESRLINVDSIEVVVPKNFHEDDFRLTIIKISCKCRNMRHLFLSEQEIARNMNKLNNK